MKILLYSMNFTPELVGIGKLGRNGPVAACQGP